MLLYFTTHRPTIVDVAGALRCPHNTCKTMGYTEPHLCFATEPLAGQGPNVFSADVAMALVEQYEYKNEFHAEKARFFALPHALVLSLHLKEEAYEQVTGRPWNEWTVIVLDRRKTAAGVLGKWAVLWASRKEAFSARVYRKVDKVFTNVIVTTTVDFDPEKDYLVVENHEETERYSGAGVKETWKVTTMAGTTPQWVIFPTAWADWVWDRRVLDSAVRYILEHVPTAKADVEYASGKDSKQNKARAWRLVAEEAGRYLSRRLNEDINLGKIAGHSWTAVAAMPHRIANRISQHLPYASWAPPKPQPEYVNPDESGRYALANLYGVYPQQGPGVDHSPQERPYTGREGELRDKPDSFNIGQRAPALSLA